VPLRQPVLRISSWLAPSFTHHPTLRSTGEEDARCVQPTSATQTKTCTRTSCVPDSLRSFRCVDLPRRLRLRTRRSGIRTVHDVRIASADRSCVLTSISNSSRTGESSVGVVFPRRTSGRASDTPVAIHVHPQRLAELPRRCLLLCLGHTSAFLRLGVDRGMRKPPRPSPTPTRESRRRVMARDAFHR